nr:hypothetical protein [uncultured Capnocytophaga sp.]
MQNITSNVLRMTRKGHIFNLRGGREHLFRPLDNLRGVKYNLQRPSDNQTRSYF